METKRYEKLIPALRRLQHNGAVARARSRDAFFGRILHQPDDFFERTQTTSTNREASPFSHTFDAAAECKKCHKIGRVESKFAVLGFWSERSRAVIASLNIIAHRKSRRGAGK